MPSPGSVVQSVLAPAGHEASSIHDLWLLMLAVTTVVYVVTMAYVLVSFARAVRHRDAPSQLDTAETTLARAVSSAVGLTVVILMVLLVASIATGRVYGARRDRDAVSIEVTGHQWWWEIEYEDAVADRHVHTANEIHIPVNRPVVFKVTSRDVIHSLWMPNFQGKRDLIPGYITAIAMQADRAGTFRGQCAEFCGMQHAHMALTVVAQADDEFNRWLDGLRAPAPDPQDDQEKRGRDLFMTVRCAGCHTVRGTGANGLVGPDLTHLASRATLAAGTLPNDAAALRKWIADPQAVKPGNQMPANPLSAADSDALVAYLESLR
jgi:cytochrome c oxidase subunit 2